MAHQLPVQKDIAMSTLVMIDLLFVAVIFGAVLYWIFIAPARARKRRHAQMYGQAGHFQAWDPGIGAKKRDR